MKERQFNYETMGTHDQVRIVKTKTCTGLMVPVKMSPTE